MKWKPKYILENFKILSHDLLFYVMFLANSEIALYEAKLKDLSSEFESKEAATNQKIQEKNAEIYKLKLEVQSYAHFW